MIGAALWSLRSRWSLRSAVLVSVALLAACADTGTGRAPSEPTARATATAVGGSPQMRTEAIVVPGAGALGGDVKMVTEVYVPMGTGPFPVVVYSHGRSGDPLVRARMSRPIPAVQVQYWMQKGFAVVAAIRPGYGPTGGADDENNGVRFDNTGLCTRRPAYDRVTQATDRALTAVLRWLDTQPWADTRRIVLEGQSVGGLATVALAATRPAGVLGYINFAGGAGGDPERAPRRSCDPEQLADLYGRFGRVTTIPNLWVYAQNDQYWGAEVPKVWHARFAEGGSRTEFIEAPAVADGDGHGLSRHAAALWAPYVDRFLRTIGF